MISGFLSSCVDDLISQNRGLRTPSEAIAREIRHIDKDLGEVQRGKVPEKLLELTKHFYVSLASRHSPTFEALRTDADQIVQDLDREILSIQVSELA